MERSLHEDKDLNSKEQSLEEITLAIRTKLDTNVNLSEDKISELEHLVKEYRKAKSFSKHQQNLRRVPPPIISEEWLELDKESIFNNPLMRNLQLSNHNIRSSQLKLYLLSSAIFPENSIIKKRCLIYWWIGQGLVCQRGDKTAEQVGEEVYHELLKQGLIEPNEDDPSPLMNRFKMHPWIRYMLISVAEAAGFFYFKSKDEASPLRKCSLSSSCLRLMVGGKDSLQYRELAKNEDVSTVFNVNEDVSTVFNVNEECLSLQPVATSPNQPRGLRGFG